jgi:triosephosphate isomerase (TIM)
MPAHRKPPFVAGNWKMHMTAPETRALLGQILAASPSLAGAEVVVLPPFTALAEARLALAGSLVALGAQNLYWEDKGAFTGEISGPMLVDLGCRYVAVGHSERRQYFGESDATVNKRLSAALRSGLMPIFCVGESLAERDSGGTLAVVTGQIERGLADIPPGKFAEIVFAYEPVWAIGTGRTASPAQAQEAHSALRGKIEKLYGKEAAACAIILYGGSVKPANSFALLREKDIDGFLVGGASLEADSFIRIAMEALRAYKEVKET